MAVPLKKIITAAAPRRVEKEDVRAAWERLARARWRKRRPDTVVDLDRGMLTVKCSSPLHRLEVWYGWEEIKPQLARQLPSARWRRVRVVLA